jgi:hypothetical protein
VFAVGVWTRTVTTLIPVVGVASVIVLLIVPEYPKYSVVVVRVGTMTVTAGVLVDTVNEMVCGG